MKKFISLALFAMLFLTSCSSSSLVKEEWCYTPSGLYYITYFTYDGENITKALVDYEQSENTATHEYDYDKLGNKTAERSFENGMLSSETVYEYENNNLIKATSYTGSEKTLDIYSVFENKNGKVVKTTVYNPDGSLLYICDTDYDEQGNITTEAYTENGEVVSLIEYKNTYTDNRLSKIIKIANGEIVTQTDFVFDKEGNKISEKVLNLTDNYYSEIKYYYKNGNLIKDEYYESDTLVGYNQYKY